MSKIDLASGNANVFAISRVLSSSGFSPARPMVACLSKKEHFFSSTRWWMNLPKGIAYGGWMFRSDCLMLLSFVFLKLNLF